MVSSPHEYIQPRYTNCENERTDLLNTSTTTTNDKHRIPIDNTVSSPLTIAMKRCITNGVLRQKVLENTIVPYYLRQPQDVYDALEYAQNYIDIDSPNENSNLLEIINIRQYETITGGSGGTTCNDNDDSSNSNSPLDGVRKLFWAIHGGSVVNTGRATSDEVIEIQKELKIVFNECFDNETGIVRGNFIACVFRKKKEIE
jgi:hypothetical protein